MTKELYRDDAYLKTCTATVTAIDERGIQFDQSIFYPLGGGQLGDTGTLSTSDGDIVQVTDTRKERDTNEQFVIVDPDSEVKLKIGDTVTQTLNWEHRYKLMRLHSCLHLMCAIINAPVNGGSIQLDRARLDFDLHEPLDKEELTNKLMEIVERDVKMSTRWISNEELAANPNLVRTMSVAPPTNAAGTIRLVEFEGVDLQACGGTHIASTAEIGQVMVRKIENKGKQNRRITVVFAQ
ncbi:MAG: alanyl-tRNA editing protein [Gammaproteobacteria bacterium]|nr:alanyl-tRNA editing protein [Gammaproteobacteria bacterium]